MRLLDLGMFRIGSEDYAEQNQSYGLATLLKEHVTLNGRRVKFDYPAKSNQRREHWVEDPQRRPGPVGAEEAPRRQRRAARLPRGEAVGRRHVRRT